MMNAEDVARLMLIIVPAILALVVVGFIVFIKWSKKDRDVNDWKDIRKP